MVSHSVSFKDDHFSWMLSNIHIFCSRACSLCFRPGFFMPSLFLGMLRYCFPSISFACFFVLDQTVSFSYLLSSFYYGFLSFSFFFSSSFFVYTTLDYCPIPIVTSFTCSCFSSCSVFPFDFSREKTFYFKFQTTACITKTKNKAANARQNNKTAEIFFRPVGFVV